MPTLKSVVPIAVVSVVVALACAGRCAIAAPSAAVQSEPTNAEEAAAKKKAMVTATMTMMLLAKMMRMGDDDGGRWKIPLP